MKRLRMRRLHPQEIGAYPVVLVGAIASSRGLPHRYDVPIVIEFIDEDSGEAIPVELVFPDEPLRPAGT